VRIELGSAVESTDGEGGNVADVIVDPIVEEQAFVRLSEPIELDRGHLWGKKDVTIPIGLVARTRNAAGPLDATRQDVGRFPEVRVRRPR